MQISRTASAVHGLCLIAACEWRIALSLAFRSIVHPTDFSPLSNRAFAHALRIALAAKCKLYLLHVAESDADHNEIALPRLRRILTQWQLIDETDPPSALASKLGIHIENVRLEQRSPADALIGFLKRDNCDLAVFATHGRDGLERWLKGSIAESVFSHAAIPTLFVPLGARGFVEQVSGDIQFRRVLIPVDSSPAPGRATPAAPGGSVGSSAPRGDSAGETRSPTAARAGWGFRRRALAAHARARPPDHAAARNAKALAYTGVAARR